MEDLSIVILSHNQCKITLQCLKSLAECPAEIVLVDNGSTDNTACEVAECFPKVRIIRNTENMGVAYGRNLGIRSSCGKWIMILDNDTEASPSEILKMYDYARSHPETGIVAPALYSSDGILQESFKPFPGIFLKFRNIIFNYRKNVRLPEHPISPFYVIGAAQMFSRAVWEKVGPLDENIFYGPEDADFCICIRRNGLKVEYLPFVSIIHHWQRATTRHIFSPLGRAHIRGLIYFYIKHKRIM